MTDIDGSHVDAATLQAIAMALGMDPNAKLAQQKPDKNFLQEIARLPVNFAGMPSGTDVDGMREWVNNVMVKGPLAEYRAKLDIKLRRPPQEVGKNIITVNATDGDGEYGIWVYEPTAAGARRPAILMLHGGGWIHGNPAGDEALAQVFASELDAVVFGIDYRLAPEHPFPKPLDDCTDALQWVIDNAPTYNIDINRIGVWGASAGGNLAAALALRCAKEAPTSQKPALALVSLVVPVTAHPEAEAKFNQQRSLPASESEQQLADATPVPEALVQEFEKLYNFFTGGVCDPLDPSVSPLATGPVPHHPRTSITVAACDGLRAQGQAYATLLRSFGVEVSEQVLPGVPHGFTMPVNATVTKLWHEKQVEEFAQAFGL
ncbi:unnamed protein product [Clonostachys rhizophaga]|uniref:Alpha/beta hydrolase fold-3 domain-containing protein n=1 Tax=Clonostachys rhizophaga TaxID=160324 RepID=A0A9N9VEM2_9HYPO|nr:unnamed protein product [Clonostachys rhizophaga]